MDPSLDFTHLTNEELFHVCKLYFDPGPISNDLRNIYIKKLIKLQDQSQVLNSSEDNMEEE